MSTGDSNFMYKLIMIFNLVMTLVTTCANEHIVENQSTASTVSQRIQDIDDGLRQAAFVLIIVLYALSALAVVILKFAMTDGTTKRILSVITNVLLCLAGISYLSGDNILLWHRRFKTEIGDIEAKDLRSYLVAFSLAFMIMSRIIPYIVNVVDDYRKPSSQTLYVKYISAEKKWELWVPCGYHPMWRTNQKWTFAEKNTKNSLTQQQNATKAANQESDEISPQQSSPLLTRESIGDKIEQICVFRTIELVCILPENNNIDAKVRWMQVGGEFIPRTEIDVTISKMSDSQKQKTETDASQQETGESTALLVKNTDRQIDRQTDRQTDKQTDYCESQILKMKGTSPMIINPDENGSWKGTFQITQFTVENEHQPLASNLKKEKKENPVQTRVLHKTAMTFLFGVYVNLIDYTLIADALYTTVLDEITHQDRNTTEGYDCPKGHIGVAIAILVLLSVAWLIAIFSVIGGSCCRNNYQHIGSWEDFKQRIFIKSVAKKINREIQSELPELFKSILKICTYCSCGQNNNPIPDTSNHNCKLLCLECVTGWVGVLCYGIILVISMAIYIIAFIIATMINCPLFIAILIFVGFIIIVFFLYAPLVYIVVICDLIPHKWQKICCCDSYSCSSGCCDECSGSGGCCDECSGSGCCDKCSGSSSCSCSCDGPISCCTKEGCTWFQCLMGFPIIPIVTLILILYLPTYLIADNKFPWICFLPNDRKTKWKIVRIILLVISFCVNIPFLLYQLISTDIIPFFNKQNHDDEQESQATQ